MLETTRADTFIYQQLTAAPALAGGRVYQSVAPPQAVSPWITFTLMAARDLNVADGARVWANLVYLVRATTQGSSYQAVQAIADAIDARLHDKAGPAGTDARVLGCLREEPHALAEVTDAGVNYRHLGGLFRVYIQSNAS